MGRNYKASYLKKTTASGHALPPLSRTTERRPKYDYRNFSGMARPSNYVVIAAQSFTTIQRTAAIANSRSTTVPPMMPATYSLACCVSR